MEQVIIYLSQCFRTFTEATSGAIKGVVSPLGANATVQAKDWLGGIVSAIPDPVTGEFLIRGLPPGTMVSTNRW
jgi:hypothetical protein